MYLLRAGAWSLFAIKSCYDVLQVKMVQDILYLLVAELQSMVPGRSRARYVYKAGVIIFCNCLVRYWIEHVPIDPLA